MNHHIKSAVGLINPDEDDYVDATGLKGKVDHFTAGAQMIVRHERAYNGICKAKSTTKKDGHILNA